MTNDPNTPPESDANLQANPHYWLYKITRDALDNENHPLHDIWHIWNRWACEGLSDAEAKRLKELKIILDDYPPFSDAEKKVIRDHIRNSEHQTNWDFPNLDEDIKFNDTTWQYPVNFSHFILKGHVILESATFFQKSYFESAIFIQTAGFRVANFTQYASFFNTTFFQKSYFESAIFIQTADFGYATFIQNAAFLKATFSQDVNFSKATFTQNATFLETTFTSNVDFGGATFAEYANFNAVKFTQNADFYNATFTGDADFSNAHFAGNIIKFNDCRFYKPTYSDTKSDLKFSFKNVVFDTKVNFAESKFYHLPNMTGVDFRGGINLDGVKFPQDFDDIYAHHEEKITGGLDAKNAERTWRAFSSEMEKSGNHEQAVKYFGYALDARSSDAKGFFKLIFKDNAGAEDWFKWILKIYKSISDYGQSISKPVWLWVKLIGIFWLFYYISLYFNNGYCNWIWDRRCDMDIRNFLISLKLAIKGAVPIVSDQTTFFDRMFKGDKEVINANNVLELGIFPLLYGFHTILSLILIFLFGLGVRHRLRLK